MKRRGVFTLILVLLSIQLSFAQGDPTLADYKLKLGLGFYDHYEGVLPTVGVEFQLLRHLSVEPTLGFTAFQREDDPVMLQATVHYKFAGGLEGKYYFLLNRRCRFEGLFGLVHLGYYRGAIYVSEENYRAYVGYQTEAGLGLGGQVYPFGRFSVGGSLGVWHVRTTDRWSNPLGQTRYWDVRSGFVGSYNLQAGVSF